MWCIFSQVNHHLTYLNLSYSGIGDRGAKHVASMIGKLQINGYWCRQYFINSH